MVKFGKYRLSLAIMPNIRDILSAVFVSSNSYIH